MEINYVRLERDLMDFANMCIEDDTVLQLVALQKHMALEGESLAPVERVFRIAISDLYKDVFLKEEK